MTVKVAIMECREVSICFHGTYKSDVEGATVAGEMRFAASRFTGDTIYTPVNTEYSFFDVEGVTIGIGFHWERKEKQSFRGSLLLRSDGEVITVINILPAEEYLKSVISSEMKATAPLEFLKAHAIISRSWLMAQISGGRPTGPEEMTETPESRIKWYDHSGHKGFDVCADDHCQRYQGITRIISGRASQAVESTRGIILTYGGKVCDTRFSKCCGGAFEKFSSCWDDKDYDYLPPGRDSMTETPLPDLTEESVARNWIKSSPEAFCNTNDPELLNSVLNGYDTSTSDFYRWKKEYSGKELSDIIKKRSGIDFGEIKDIIPIERGVSGRLVRIKISGTARSMTIGKELEIRRTLSDTHLYSSAFFIEKRDMSPDGLPGRFIFHGAGWGHGVGLCQIGAAAMAMAGFSHQDILIHYYPGSSLTRL